MATKAKKTANIRVRVEPNIKESVEELYASFGITLSDAVTMFIHKSLMEGGLPFSLTLPHYADTDEVAERAVCDDNK